jgi:hypothetical protein
MEEPFMTGKAYEAKCFKNSDIRNTSVDRKSNRKVWMTSHIMGEWLKAFNTKMRQQKHLWTM